MYLLGYVLLLTAALCCTAAPASDGSCPRPPRMTEAELQGDWDDDSYPQGKQAAYLCRPGYSRLGSIKSICSEGKWISISSGQCKIKSCGHPGDIASGSFKMKNEDSFIFGAIVEYSCDDGYRMVSKERTRQCTASGWSNYLPHCEVRKCPPIGVASNINILSTVYDEEYSVGQVVRFECKDPSLKLNGLSEVFCTSGGEWNSDPPTCTEISCKLPSITKGIVNNRRDVYKNTDIIYFTCEEGFQATKNGEATCTKDDWNPKPSCIEITCNPLESVTKGKLVVQKSVYTYGEEIKVECDDGYVLQTEPNKWRKCTANGWYPPSTCVNKLCDKPVIAHGGVSWSWRSFPRDIGGYIDYYCDSYYTPATQTRVYCTKRGWDTEPKCARQCFYRNALLDNAELVYPRSTYTEGENVRFRCNKNYHTLDGNEYGERTCLPNGEFTPAKCSRTCQAPNLLNGKFSPDKNEFQIGEYLQYECSKGYMTKVRSLLGIAQCLGGGWSEPPSCIPITCKGYEVGSVVTYECKGGQRPEYDIVQCFYYGWGPPTNCRDKDSTPTPETNVENPSAPDSAVPPSGSKDKTEQRQKCPHAFSPKNAEIIDPKEAYYSNDKVTMRCLPGFKIYGSPTIQCIGGIWEQPLECIASTKCKNPQTTIKNGVLIESSKQTYVADDVVQYECNFGYDISGSDKSTCMNSGQWSPLPVCIEKTCGEPPNVQYAAVSITKNTYSHGEGVQYICNKGYGFSGDDSARCIRGEWINIPTCVETSCGRPPNVRYAKFKQQPKIPYTSGETFTYVCESGYSLEVSGDALCKNTQWIDLPVCRRTGEQCGPPPHVPSGDTEQTRKPSYKSGEFVTYRCPSYYVLNGEKIVKCMNGIWSEAPVCLEPCTASQKDMQQNNIQLRWSGEKKLYSKHGDSMEFQCISEYEAPSGTTMRSTCDKGKLEYPKCFRSGFCVLQQSTMITNNIQYNVSSIVNNGEKIPFQCNEGMNPENKLEAKCESGKINYPRCTATKSCKTPKILNGFIKSEQQNSYDSGSNVEFDCNEGYVIKGSRNVKCENGQWSDLPVCQGPCKLSLVELTKSNIQLLLPSELDTNYRHGTELTVTCKSGFKRPAQGGALWIVCEDGKFSYTRCFSGKICRINQNELDEKELELDESHNNEVLYAEGEEIKFKCKGGSRFSDQRTGTCSDEVLEYPDCRAQSSV